MSNRTYQLRKAIIGAAGAAIISLAGIGSAQAAQAAPAGLSVQQAAAPVAVQASAVPNIHFFLSGDICDICGMDYDPEACAAAGRVTYDSTEQHPDGSPLYPTNPVPTAQPSKTPTKAPTKAPAKSPTKAPTKAPANAPAPNTGGNTGNTGSAGGAGGTGGAGSNGTGTNPGTANSTTKGTQNLNTNGLDDSTGTADDLAVLDADGNPELEVTEDLIGATNANEDGAADGNYFATSQVSIDGEARPGNEITILGSGFPTDLQNLEVEIHSVATHLAVVDTAADGTFQIRVIIPTDVEPGDHTIVILNQGTPIAQTPLTVAEIAPEQSSTTAAGLAVLGGLVLAGIGGWAVQANRKRRPQTATAAA